MVGARCPRRAGGFQPIGEPARPPPPCVPQSFFSVRPTAPTPPVGSTPHGRAWNGQSGCATPSSTKSASIWKRSRRTPSPSSTPPTNASTRGSFVAGARTGARPSQWGTSSKCGAMGCCTQRRSVCRQVGTLG